MSDDTEPPVGAFQFLVARAREFVDASGGCVAEELLIAHVFGTTKSPQIWNPLFETVIQHAPDLRKRFDGQWAFVDAARVDQLLLGDFVAVDVETTGLRPTAHRIIEVGLARYANGQLTESLSMLCNPERKLPAYISKLTGLHDEELITAPLFEEVADSITAFIAGSVIAGHNVDFDLRFLNAELKRAGRQTLINERIDSMALAMRLLPHVRRPGLDKVAKALGLSPRNVHRALGDAQMAASCAMLLLKLAQDQGITSIDDLRQAASVPEPSPRDHVGRARSVLDTSHLESVPRCPGVYLMRDPIGRVIYAGKAKNLRERVASYYAQPLGYTRKMDGLIESVAAIDTEITGTELEALILEAQLIRRYQPRFNRALRAHEQYPYIRVTMSSPWPRICLASKSCKDGDLYFGPYRNRNAVKRAVELLNTFLPLRTCPRSFKSAKSYGSPCLRLDLHQCLGPCVGRANRGAYLASVNTAIRFLEGDDFVLTTHIHQELEHAAEQQDFERARQLRNAISDLQLIGGAARRLQSDPARRHKLLILPAHDELAVNVAIVAGGRIWATCQATRRQPVTTLAEKLRRAYDRLLLHGDPVIDQTTLDDTLILTRWLEKNEGHPAIVLRHADERWDWLAIAKNAQHFTYDDFVSWSAPVTEDDLLVETVQPGREPEWVDPASQITMTDLPAGLGSMEESEAMLWSDCARDR